MVANSRSCIVQYTCVQLDTPAHPGTLQHTYAHTYTHTKKCTQKAKGSVYIVATVLVSPQNHMKCPVGEGSGGGGYFSLTGHFETTNLPQKVCKKAKKKKKCSVDKQK